MREILFKAKSDNIDGTFDWVEGYLSKCDGKWTICDDDGCGCFIDENTICQYTGLTDKHGSKIWENDIVKDGESLIAKIVFNKFQFACHVFKSEYVLTLGCTFPLHQWDKDVKNDLRQLEVIGNIFDNTDLLEV